MLQFFHYSCAFLLTAGLLQAGSAGGLSWDDPEGWESQPRQMRAANYVVPPLSTGDEPGEFAVYYFGPGQGGSVEANIDRWVGQFQAPDGDTADKVVERSEKTVNGIPVTLLEVEGVYMFKPFPMARQATPKPGYKMLAAIAEGEDAPIFFKLTAPEDTAAAAEETFHAVINSLERE